MYQEMKKIKKKKIEKEIHKYKADMHELKRNKNKRKKQNGITWFFFCMKTQTKSRKMEK